MDECNMHAQKRNKCAVIFYIPKYVSQKKKKTDRACPHADNATPGTIPKYVSTIRFSRTMVRESIKGIGSGLPAAIGSTGLVSFQ